MNSFLVFAAYITIGWLVAYVLIDDGKPRSVSVFVACIWPVALIVGSLLALQEWWKKKMEADE